MHLLRRVAREKISFLTAKSFACRDVVGKPWSSVKHRRASCSGDTHMRV